MIIPESEQQWKNTSTALLAGLLLFLLAFLAFLALPLSGEAGRAGTDTEFSERLDQRIPALMKRYQIPGVSLAVVRQGKTAFSRAYGYANLETGQAMTPDTWCRMESISKSLTAWGVMTLVDDGRIALDQPVGRYIKSWQFPASGFPTDAITVGQLLSHTSGLALGTIGERYEPGQPLPTLRESLTRNARMIRAPGEAFEYSNVGYHLLELLIEEVSGLDFAGYMEEEVLKPLGMHGSGFRWREAYGPGFPLGYDAKGLPIAPYVYPEKASGGLISTVGEIAAFVCAAMPDWQEDSGRVLHAATLRQLYEIRVRRMGFYSLAFDGYGYGHFIERLPNGLTAVAHGGQGTGWMTHFHALPDSGDAIVIVTNSQRSWPFFAGVLTLWAEWNGFSRVGMSKLIRAEQALMAILVLVLLLAAWQGVKITRQCLDGRRRLAPLSKARWKPRLLLALGFLLMAGVYAWALTRPYLFFPAIFPLIARWLVILVPFLALVMILAALCPPVEKPIQQERMPLPPF